jgi:hypothetical protein
MMFTERSRTLYEPFSDTAVSEMHRILYGN